MKEWCPADIIAILIVASATFLISQGKDGTIAAALLAIVAFYFGVQHEASPVKALIKRNR